MKITKWTILAIITLALSAQIAKIPHAIAPHYTASPITIAKAQTPPPAPLPPPAPIVAPKKAYSTQELVNLVTKTFENYGLNPNLGLCLAFHESQWEYNRIGDIGNVHGISVGLFQISLAQNGITEASATDPVFATNWSAQQIAAGNVDWWSTRRLYCSTLPVME